MEEVEKIIPLKIIKKKKKFGYVLFTVENDCKISFRFNTVCGGFKGKNTFVLSFTMVIHNPFLSKILMESFGKINDDPATKDLVLVLDYLNSLPKEWNVYERYAFSGFEDKAMTAERLLRDIECCFIPYCVPFVRDYGKIVDNYSNPAFVKNIGNWSQFITGVACALLTHQEAKIEEIIVPLAKSNTNRIEFLEFKNSKDYKTELILPIKEYIDKHITNKEPGS